MTRSPSRLAVAAFVAALALTGCGSSATNDDRPVASAPTAAPAPVASPDFAPQPGVPSLTGTPLELSTASQALAGTGAPPTQLVTQDVVVGSGTAATPADTVDVRYTGTLYSDGKVFDSSWKRGQQPATFPLDQVVPGFTQGIEGMQPGGRRVIVMPPALAYGERGRPGIPGNATLVFVVDLVGVS